MGKSNKKMWMFYLVDSTAPCWGGCSCWVPALRGETRRCCCPPGGRPPAGAPRHTRRTAPRSAGAQTARPAPPSHSLSATETSNRRLQWCSTDSNHIVWNCEISEFCNRQMSSFQHLQLIHSMVSRDPDGAPRFTISFSRYQVHLLILYLQLNEG